MRATSISSRATAMAARVHPRIQFGLILSVAAAFAFVDATLVRELLVSLLR